MDNLQWGQLKLPSTTCTYIPNPTRAVQTPKGTPWEAEQWSENQTEKSLFMVQNVWYSDESSIQVLVI